MKPDTQLHSQTAPASQSSQAPYTVCSNDGRVTATVYPGRPPYVLVRYQGASEGEVEAALHDLARSLPPLCCIITVPQHWPI